MKQEVPPALAFLEGAIAEARGRQLLRERAAIRPDLVSFCSNDYLGLAGRVAPAEVCGAGASRLVDGERPVHARLEEAAARLARQASALVFTSGYAANVGALGALAGPGDTIVSDALNHASLIDGARLSKARVVVVPHLDVGAIDEALGQRGGGRAFVVTESYYSMDGDSPDLAALRRVCDAHGAVMFVDEAHALGVLGPGGAGLCAQAGVVPDVLVGTFGKAFGAGGAFVAGCRPLTTWLWNRARSFVFSTGLSPVVAAAGLEGMAIAQREPWRRQAVARWAMLVRERLGAMGLRLGGSGHIVPWIVGDPATALGAAARLAERGLDVRAIRPPTVPPGTARLRLTLSAARTESDIGRLLDAVAAIVATGLP